MDKGHLLSYLEGLQQELLAKRLCVEVYPLLLTNRQVCAEYGADEFLYGQSGNSKTPQGETWGCSSLFFCMHQRG